MSKNVYSDLDIEDAEEMSVKAGLVSQIERILNERNLNQSEVLQITGIAPEDISTIRRGQFHNISMERLIDAVRSLGCDVDIVVHDRRREGELGKLAVLTAA